ncbi:MAG TPA: SDR family oxidoreductase [Rhodopila sp.]|uniref:SDR family NAD(P)-dependent oxidoreductase n=1 Tax=Rhodopila sp. TaxID=2480087 RepID=UPI002C6D4E72|nr:SDR family oxidoreductase [Rhodopila sp.]HVY13806.1 SDR family oxidoreductase [Rhodopila sp.]
MAQNSAGLAVVTGASTGIGAVYADRLARRGHDLLLVARNRERLEANAAKIAAETGRKVEVLVADLANGADVAKLAERLATDPSVTLLVNNAGVSLTGTLLDTDPAAVEGLMALNIVAPTLLAGAAGKAFLARNAGTIVNISSVLALAPERFDGVYSGSKAHLLNLTLSLAETLKGTGVKVQAVLPGATRTEIWERSGKDVDALLPGRVMDAGDMVDAALLGLDRGEVVTIPPLADEGLFQAYTAARLALTPFLSERDVAPRYRKAA